jgi:subtilisin-like proprotein convertase family protein
MKSSLSRRVARLAHLFRNPPVPRRVGRPRFRPVLEGLEERSLRSTLSLVNPAAGSAAAPARFAASSPVVVAATDVPQPVDFLDVFTTSSVYVPQGVTVGSLKVQLGITYPLDNDLTIDLIAPDGTDVPLSYFEGSGANFQGTVFDDNAATPIWAGDSPFAGSYRPETPLSAVAGMNAQGTWQLQIIDWGASYGTLNSWSLIIQPTGSPVTASSLVVGGFPPSTTAGQAGSFTVTAEDANGNVATGYTGTVHFTSSDPHAGLPADYTFTAADAGRHTFTTTLTTAGTQSLTATDTAAGGLTATEAGITVSPAPASRLAVSAPAAATAGGAFNVTLTAQDAYGNTATGYGGVVHLSSSDGQAVLPANAPLSNGTGTFSVTLKTAGSESLTATDTAAGSLGGSVNVAVTPAAASTLVVTAPASATAGAAFSVTVTAKDTYGNTATGYGGAVHFSTSDAAAGVKLPAAYTFTAADHGTHTFGGGVTLATVGSQTVTASDGAVGPITGSTTVSVVAPAPATHLGVTVPGAVTAGSAFSITVTALAAGGGTATGYTGTVQFSSSDGRAILPASYTFTAADHGAHTFTGLVLDTAGTQSLSVRDSASSSIAGGGSVAVSAAAASRFVVRGIPSSLTAGTAANFTVTVTDAFGNVATGYRGTVHFTSTDPQAALPANYTFMAADAGRHTFSAVLKTAGTQSLTAADTVNGSRAGTEAGIGVSPAAASRLLISAPSTATAGTAFNVTVTTQDAYGNTATGYAGIVHFSSSDGQAVLPVNSTLVNGTGVFSLTLRTAGSQTVSATDAATGAPSGNASVSVSPTGSGALVFQSADTPLALNPSNLYVESAITVPQSVTIASLKVQVNITYPMDSDLRINLIYIDSAGFQRAYVSLSSFVGAGANFQDTIFDDAAATPIAAGTPPFAGSYRPSDPLSAFVGLNAQGSWYLDVGDFVGGSGTINSWSLIIQPAASLTTPLAAAAPGGTTATPVPAPAPLGSLAPVVSGSSGVVTAGLAGAPPSLPLLGVGDPALAGPPAALAAGDAEVSAGPRPVARAVDVRTAVGTEAVRVQPIVPRPDGGHVRKILPDGSSDRPADAINDGGGVPGGAGGPA